MDAGRNSHVGDTLKDLELYVISLDIRTILTDSKRASQKIYAQFKYHPFIAFPTLVVYLAFALYTLGVSDTTSAWALLGKIVLTTVSFIAIWYYSLRFWMYTFYLIRFDSLIKMRKFLNSTKMDIYSIEKELDDLLYTEPELVKYDKFGITYWYTRYMRVVHKIKRKSAIILLVISFLFLITNPMFLFAGLIIFGLMLFYVIVLSNEWFEDVDFHIEILSACVYRYYKIQPKQCREFFRSKSPIAQELTQIFKFVKDIA